MRPTKVLLLLDETALWRVAGLTQLERIAFSFADFAIRNDHTFELFLFWRPDLPAVKRAVPDDARFRALTPISTEAPPADVYLVLSSRQIITPEAVGWALDHAAQRIDSPSVSWDHLAQRIPVFAEAPLRSAGELAGREKAFFAGMGKPQDGPVAQYVNRPVSRWLSRRLINTAVTPNQWTLMITVLPVLGSLLLARGTYWSFAAGALLYQFYSMLDGCDGEIARAKFLATKLGRRLDTACDLVAGLLMLIALGLGCARAAGPGSVLDSFSFQEGVVAAGLVALYEGFLYLGSRITAGRGSSPGSTAVYSRHQHLIAYSGILKLGHTTTAWLIQLTKRDVVLLLFLLCALVGQPQLLLHAYLVFGAIAAPLAGLALFRAWQGARLPHPVASP